MTVKYKEILAGNEPMEKDGESEGSSPEVDTKREEDSSDDPKTAAVDSEDAVAGGSDESSGATARVS
jgi:hypothetical protein